MLLTSNIFVKTDVSTLGATFVKNWATFILPSGHTCGGDCDDCHCDILEP